MLRNLSAVAAAGLLVLNAPARASDHDLDWVGRALGGNAAAAAKDTEPTAKVRKRTVIEYTGLAKIELDDTAPKAKRDSCIPAQLQSVLSDVEAKFGTVNITSTCRTASANRAAGGAPQSLHLIGQAVDFRVSGSSGAVMAFLTGHSGVGGLKHYGGGLFHIDTGARRPF